MFKCWSIEDRPSVFLSTETLCVSALWRIAVSWAIWQSK